MQYLSSFKTNFFLQCNFQRFYKEIVKTDLQIIFFNYKTRERWAFLICNKELILYWKNKVHIIVGQCFSLTFLRHINSIISQQDICCSMGEILYPVAVLRL